MIRIRYRHRIERRIAGGVRLPLAVRLPTLSDYERLPLLVGMLRYLEALALLLVLQGCFGEPPTVEREEAAEGDGEGEGDGGDAESSSSSTTGLVTTVNSNGSGEATSEPADASSSSSSSSSSEDSSGSSSSGEPVADYPPCSECVGQPCVGDGEGAGACAPECGAGCPDPGWGLPACLNEVADGTQALVCFLDCTASRSCEAGMLCLQTDFTAGGEPLFACMWGAP